MNTITSKLRDKIRYAVEPDDPQLISQWIKLETTTWCCQTHEQQWVKNDSVIRLLLDTLADELLPAHWRMTCLDYIFLPLGNLYHLAHTEEDIFRLNQLVYEIRITSNFFNPELAGTPVESYQG